MFIPLFEVVDTSDGSSSVRSTQFQALYHSHHGALAESHHVFIHSGLDYLIDHNPTKHIRILEFGFGTGLNALLSQIWATARNIRIDYTTLEKYPLNEEVYAHLNYGQLLESEKEFLTLHQCPWGQKNQLTPLFQLTKIESDFLQWEPTQQNDLLYYDAFGPLTQPELWTNKMTDLSARSLRSGGVLVTFCSQGAFRRHLTSSGYKVSKIAGPPGKREMVRAVKV